MTRCAQEKTLPFAKRTYYTPSVRRASQRCGGAPRSAAGCVLVSFTLVALVVGTANARLLRVLDDPSDGQGGEFGRALAVVGTDLAVGAPGARVFDQDRAGRVQLYGSDGVLLRTFEAQNPVAEGAFGSMVAASDGLLYVGAPGDQPIGLGGVGAVYVFDVATGVLTHIVPAPDPDASTMPVGGGPAGPGVPQSTSSRPDAMGFGRALATVGDRILVGAPDSSVDGLAGAGAVYVFDTQGTLIRTVREISPHANASFGASVAMIGDILFVGAPGAPAGGVDGAGDVQAFDARTGAWLRTLSSALPAEGADFGAVVGEIDGALFVGAPGDRALGIEGAGAVYLFEVESAALRKIISPPTAAPWLGFGRAVGVLAGNLLVGADGAGPDQSGKAYLIDPVTFAIRTTFEPTIARGGGHFGFALAAIGPAVAIGEPAFGVTSGSGRVYLFDLAPQPTGGGPRRLPTNGGGQPAPPAESCAPAPTAVSVDCRVNALLGTMRQAGLRRLASPLRRVRREVRRADGARGARRGRAFSRAVRGVGEFARRLESPGGRTDVSAELRHALLAAASAVEVDLRALSASIP